MLASPIDLGLVLEAVERRHRPERLLAGDHHVGRALGQHGRLVELAAAGVALAARQHLGALAPGVLDVALDLVDRGGLDQRPLLDAGLVAGADLERLDRLGELRRERVVDAVLDVDPVGADAGLAAVAELAGDGALDRGVDVGVVEDDQAAHGRPAPCSPS